MITAQEAKERLLKMAECGKTVNLQQVNYLVEQAIAHGLSFIKITEFQLSEAEVKYIEKLGYTILINIPYKSRNPDYTMIKW